jgi:hypothetical protein
MEASLRRFAGKRNPYSGVAVRFVERIFRSIA